MSDEATRVLAEKAFEAKRLRRRELARLPIERKLEILLDLQRTVNKIALAAGRPTKSEWPREILPEPPSTQARRVKPAPDSPPLSPAEVDRLVEELKKDVDRTLIRENFKLTVEERLRSLMSHQRFADELRRAGRELRRRP